MRGLHGLAWRGLRARPLRTSLTALGVALGVAVLFAGLATNAGIDAAVDRAVATMVGRADLRIAAFSETGLSDATQATVAAVPGVEVAAPSFERRTYLGTGEFGPGPLPPPVTIVGIDPALEPRIHDLALAAGDALSTADTVDALDPPDAPEAPDAPDATEAPEALVSATLAREDGIALGDRLGLQGLDAPIYLRVVGILAGDGPWGGVTGRAVVTHLRIAQSVFGADGLTRIDVRVEPGADADVVAGRIQASVQDEPYVSSSPSDLAAAMEASTGDFAATTALIAAVALFAGAFLIFNTLSMTVVERVRELGLLRAAGATRRQITAYILVQATVIGIVGAIVGLVLGTALAAGVVATLGSVGKVVLGAPVVTVRDILIAVGLGVGVTIAAAIEPARRAGRIPPVEALRSRLDVVAARRARLRWLVLVFAVVGLFGFTIWPRPPGDAALIRALAVYGLLLGVALAVPFALPGLTRLAGAPFAVPTRLEERLARASVLRDRVRAALTVGALTIGLAMVVALGAVGQHAHAVAGGWIGDVVPGDLVLTSIFPRDREEGIDETLGTLPGVHSISPIATFDIAIDGVRFEGTAMRGADLEADGRLHIVDGDRTHVLAALDEGGEIVVPSGIAARDGLAIGSRLTVVASDGSAMSMRVAGIAERTLPGPSGETLLVGWADADRLGIDGADAFAVRFEPGASEADRLALAEEARSLALEPVPLDRIQGAIGAALDRVFGLFDALSLVAVVVASLGIINTLTINVLERVREIGVLRAAGMTRRQVWRSVVVEAGITGLVGALCGVATGIAIGGLMVVLGGGRWDPAASLPWLAIGTAFVLGVALAMLAAAYPARLASGISIVRAVAYE